MKNYLVHQMLVQQLIGLTLLLSSGSEAATKIEQVLVFTDRAQVTRVGDVACGPSSMLEFSLLPPSIDAASLRAEAGSAAIESMELKSRARSEAFSAQVEALDNKLRGLERDLAEQRDAVIRAKANVSMAQALAKQAGEQISHEMGVAGVDPKAWGSSYDQALAAQLRGNEEIGKAQTKIRAFERAADEARLERSKLQTAGGKTERFAEVRVSCAAGETAHVTLTYVVGGASWSPAYEARAIEKSDTVSLELFGTVTQATGEDWTKARLILSNALPRTDATPPHLAPLTVYAEKREPPKKVLVQRQEEREHAEAGSANGPDMLDANNQGLSTQFPVAELSDVAGDGTPTRVSLTHRDLHATFAWRLFLSQLPYVFRAADIENTAGFALLAGPVDLFRNGSMMGRSQLERVAAGAPFHLSFGLEERLHVKRIIVTEGSQGTGVFTKGRRYDFHYAFELQSLLPAPIALEISDRVPVSELDDVHVSIDEATTPGYVLVKDDGLVRWKQALGANEKKRLELSFHVDVPNSYAGN
jgi:uncharacterized protein (TIGR02231 family)